MDKLEQRLALENEYLKRCREGSDINEHLPVLRVLAMECRTICEFGTRDGNSSVAWLAAQPFHLWLYDCNHKLEVVSFLKGLAGNTMVTDVTADTTRITAEDCDLLFIDTDHHYRTCSAELARSGNRARKYIVFHDTEAFGKIGNDGESVGLLPAIDEFLAANPQWSRALVLANNNGLTVLRRIYER